MPSSFLISSVDFGKQMESSRCQIWFVFLLIILLVQIILCSSSIYKVGDLHGWSIPSSSNPQVYTKWAQFNNLTAGDSIFFLYPPSQDSVIRVKKEAFDACDLKDPILSMNDGNSLFNVTKGGNYYFTSGVEGHCQKSQKLHIFVYGGDGSNSADSEEAEGPTAPSYPTVFGSIPALGAANSTSSSSSKLLLQIPLPAALVMHAVSVYLFFIF